MKPIVIASASYKGGPGKSFIATTLAGLLNERGHKVLVIDLDGQCAQTENLDVDVDPERTFEQWEQGHVEDPMTLAHPTKTPGIALIPAHPDIVNVAHNQKTYTQVKRLLAAFEHCPFAYIVLDTAPASHPLSMAALLAADYFITPLKPAIKEVVNSLMLFDRDVEQARMFNPGLKDLGIIINQHDHEAPEQKRILADLAKRVNGRLLPVSLGISRDVVNAEHSGLPITIYKPNSQLSRRVREAFKPVLAQLLPVDAPKKTKKAAKEAT